MQKPSKYMVKVTLGLLLAAGIPVIAQTAIPSGTNIASDTVWALTGSPFVVCAVTVSAGAALTIQPGVVVKIQPDCSALSISGHLVANGTQGQPIVFTSLRDDAVAGDTNGDGGATTPAAGDWQRILFSSGSNGSFSNVVFRYGGSTASGGFPMLDIESGNNLVSVTNCSFADTLYYGLKVSGAGSNPTITNNSFARHLTGALQLGNPPTDTAGATVTGNTFSSTISIQIATSASVTVTGNTVSVPAGGFGIETFGPVSGSITNNTITTTGAGAQAISLDPDLRATLSGNTSTGSGVNAALLRGGTLTGGNISWGQLSMPYYVCGPTIGAAATVTIQPGVVLKADSSCSLNISGHLVANGTQGQPIVFTSLRDDAVFGDTNGDGGATTPAAGDWQRILFSSGSNGSFSNVVFRYGGSIASGGFPMLDIESGNNLVGVTNCSFTYSQGIGIVVAGAGTAPSLSNLTITRNGVGLQASAGATPHIQNSNIFGNAAFGVLNTDCPSNVACAITPDIDARNNWWGSASGPWRDLAAILNSDRVSYHVNVSPYLSQATKGGVTPPPASTSYGGASTTNPVYFASEPVNTATGNYYNSTTDLAVRGKGLSFSFTRSYNSQNSSGGPLGFGWTHSYNVFLSVDGSGNVAITQGDGHQDFYAPAGGGSYTAQTFGLLNMLIQNADTTFTLTFKNQTKFNFSNAGKLLTIVDRNGNTQTLAYAGAGTLSSVTDPSGRAFSFAYDASARVTSVSDPLGRILHYSYDASGNLVSFQDALGNTTQYAYDGSHRMTSATDPRGNVYMQNVYDAQSPARVIKQTNSRGFVTTFAYNTPASGITTVTDPLANATQYVYDAGQRLSGIVDANGGVTSYTYDGNNLKLSETNALGKANLYSYDGAGNVLTTTDAAGSTTVYTYDALNHLLSVTDPLVRQSTFSYDARGNLLAAHDALGGVTTNTYDAAGQLLSTTDARGKITAYQYDSNGNRSQITDALNGVSQMTYDVVGHLLNTKNPLGKTWMRTYDADDRLLSTTDPLGDQSAYGYDGNGNRTQITDANGNVTAYGYDVNNNLVQVTDAMAGITSYSYNGNDDQTGITDAKSHVTTIAYDNLRRVHGRTDPLGRAQTYAYDAAGNLTSTIDGNAKTNAFSYDAVNRRVGAALSDGKSVAYGYDAAGNRISMTDWRGTTQYSYDLLNRVTSVKQQDGSTVSYSYDSVGNRASITYPDGKAVTYQYDALNRLAQTTDWASQATTNSYDAAGNLTGTVLPNGASSTNAFDDAGRLVSVFNRSGAQVTSGYSYVLDRVGNRMEVASFNEGIERYGYDRLYRLTSWTAPSRQETRYAYDAVGNRASLADPTGTVIYAYDVADQLLTATGTAFTYDGNGNQLTKTTGATTMNYGWDAVNRLTSVAGGSVNTQYQYDGDGNRVSQQTSTGTYAYVIDTASGLPVTLNENGPDGNISYAFGTYLISGSAVGFQSFYQFDGLGSVATVTDQSAATKAAYAYDPWGSGSSRADSLGNKNKYKFTGEPVDLGASLIFLRARYYDQNLGRFVSKDLSPGSKSFPLTQNRYVYAVGNPLLLVDHSGLSIGSTLSGFFGLVNDQGARQQNMNACIQDPTDECAQQDQKIVQRALGNAQQVAQGSESIIYNPTTIGIDTDPLKLGTVNDILDLPSNINQAFSINSAGGDATGSDLCIVNPANCSGPNLNKAVLMPRGPHK